MKKRLSSFDENYTSGSLSVFPKGKDSTYTLYKVNNNAITKLKHTLMPSSKYITVESTNNFPDCGILRLQSNNGKSAEVELIYYGAKVNNQFHHLQRGFAGFTTFTWQPNSIVSLPVMAEHHNALKDSIINIQKKIGLVNNNPAKDSILGILKSLEDKHLTPKSSFRAFPKSGKSPLMVKFQNTSTGHVNRFLWDFGDGATSTEKNPVHIYEKQGNYSVKLNVISENNSHGISEKIDYIKADNSITPFYYIYPNKGNVDTEFEFNDQTEANIIERHWNFGDGNEITTENHVVSHQYKESGIYNTSLISVLENKKTLKSSEIVIVG